VPFSRFITHGRVHSIHISLEPPKALAENTNESCVSSSRTADELAARSCPSRLSSAPPPPTTASFRSGTSLHRHRRRPRRRGPTVSTRGRCSHAGAMTRTRGPGLMVARER
jgi:hypothetical protein